MPTEKEMKEAVEAAGWNKHRRFCLDLPQEYFIGIPSTAGGQTDYVVSKALGEAYNHPITQNKLKERKRPIPPKRTIVIREGGIPTKHPKKENKGE